MEMKTKDWLTKNHIGVDWNSARHQVFLYYLLEYYDT